MSDAEEYRLGHGLVDSQHELLFGLIADLERKVAENHDGGVLIDVMERLYSYAALHFATEDRLMIETNYPDISEHRMAHEALLGAMKCLDNSIQSGVVSAPEEALQFMKAWAMDHIPSADRKLVDHLLKCGVGVRPSNAPD